MVNNQKLKFFFNRKPNLLYLCILHYYFYKDLGLILMEISNKLIAFRIIFMVNYYNNFNCEQIKSEL